MFLIMAAIALFSLVFYKLGSVIYERKKLYTIYGNSMEKQG